MMKLNKIEEGETLLVESVQYTPSHSDFKKLDQLCFLSKNLYNSCLYEMRQSFFNTGHPLNYNQVYSKFMKSDNSDYRALPAQISQQTMRLVEKNFSSFLAASKSYAKNPEKFLGKPHLPKYLDKVNGRQEVHITKQYLKYNGVSRTVDIKCFGLSIPSKVTNPEYVKIVFCNKLLINIVVGYKLLCNNLAVKQTNYASIDLGLNNLATVFISNHKTIIVNGRPLKSINQYYNKQLADMKSNSNFIINKQYTKHMYKITNKRNNKINDFMHKSSSYIVNQLVKNQVSVLVVGYNPGWKQDINIGHKNNQNFVHVPFLRFIEMLRYKCKLQGIVCITTKESYTSKCSFVDKEDIKHHETYVGKRVKRGLFRTHNGSFINCDLNGALNILRKFLNEAGKNIYKIIDPVEAVALQPVKINIF